MSKIYLHQQQTVIGNLDDIIVVYTIQGYKLRNRALLPNKVSGW